MQGIKAMLLTGLLVLQISVSQARDIDDIKQVVQQAYDNIWSKMDIDAIDTFHTIDFTLLNNGEDAWSNFDVVIYLKGAKKLQSKTLKRSNSFEFLEHKIYDNLAWISFYNTGQFSDATSRVSETKWLESAFLVKENDIWKFQLLHSTRVDNP